MDAGLNDTRRTVAVENLGAVGSESFHGWMSRDEYCH